jgi:ABC-2 type transport system ATP-binding protein
LQIRLESVSRKYGRVRALDQVSMAIEPGQIVSLLGANGAGKTTLLRCLSSIVVPDKGTILFDGELFRRGRLDLRRRLAFLPDFPVMYGHMKPLQHIAMVLRLYEKENTVTSERAIEVLGSLDLLPFIDTFIQQLSRGQIYKTALAAVILTDPEVWLLDEPLASGMDPAGIAGLKKECRAAAARGRIVLYSTQLLDIAETFSDRVCVLNRGKLELFEEVSAIQARAAKPEGALEELFLKLRTGA